MRVAIIDLGTNTSNLVIAGLVNGAIRIDFQSKEYVRLGDKSIGSNIISNDAFQRGIGVIQRQTEIAKQWNCNRVRIIATSAVRHAINRDEFSMAVKNSTGIELEIIDGFREATLIYYGVKLAMGSLPEPSAILDIGGGSNEVIICENGTVNWQGSYSAGMSRIINAFSISDPIQPFEIEQLEAHFESEHSEAIEQCLSFGVTTLIGCSGAFNTIADVLEQINPEEDFRSAKEINLPEFYKIYSQIVPTTHEERRSMQGMDPMRTDLIVPALILCRKFIEKSNIQKIIQTSYALREGVLYEMLNS
jgi:exopolyphosphatase/guanosine-5'-triphosphate,3'-diphosphate pyrophosphatase